MTGSNVTETKYSHHDPEFAQDPYRVFAEVRTKCPLGHSTELGGFYFATTYEGVWLSDVLKKAGVPFGSGMRGAALSAYIVASASDGYQVVFSVGEVDPDMTDGQYLLADKANGKALFGENGAFRLVVPKDKRGARSVRMLTSLNVVQLKK